MSKEEHGNDLVTARTPPPLPRSLIDPVPVVVVGTLAFLVAFVVLLLVGAPPMWTWSCLAGFGLGFFGYGVFRWQRSAARRGSRTAQEGLL
jgi:hypothetical protein